MPGIAGIITSQPGDEPKRLVKSMIGSMKYEPFYSSGICCLPEMGVYAGWAAREDCFAAGQPFVNKQRDIVLLLSGECFRKPDTSADAKCNVNESGERMRNWLVNLYEKEGDHFFESLNGLFSGLLIDRRRNLSFLFNDRYGIERVYIHESQDSTYFASEAKALLRVLPQLRAFDNQGVAEFLTYGCTLGGRTLFRGIQLLPGASLWSFEERDCRKSRYFSTETWESQPPLSAETFQSRFEEVFKRVLPSYFESQTNLGISLTGGLDTRLIMACRPTTHDALLCYTFSGIEGLTLDDRLAAQVAKACALDHRLLRIGPDFFSGFANLTDQTVYVTDGCLGPAGAHEIYFNKQARELAPVRLTGNYGSELFRGISTFKPLGLSPDLFEREFVSSLKSAAEAMPSANENRVTFSAFREIPCKLIGTLLAARSQIVFRTPYLDNEMVALAYQNPDPLSRSPRKALRVIQKNNPVLATIGSDMGFRAVDGQLLSLARYLVHKATFKLDYIYNDALPDSLSPLEPIFRRVGFGIGILGLHKYLHYRGWFRRELANYLHEAVTEAQAHQSGFWNPGFVKRMVEDHISGRRSYVGEINAVLTLDAIERLLFRDLPGMAEVTARANSTSTAAILQ